MYLPMIVGAIVISLVALLLRRSGAPDAALPPIDLRAALSRVRGMRRSSHTSNSHFATVVDNINEATLVFSAAGELRFANAAALSLFAQPNVDALAALTARDLGEFFGIEPTELPWQKVLRNEQEASAQLISLCASGGDGAAVMVKASPVFDRHGRLDDVIVLLAPSQRPCPSIVHERADHLDFLARASEELAGSLDLAKTLNAIAELAVSRLADWCTVDMVSDLEDVLPRGAAHLDARLSELVRAQAPALNGIRAEVAARASTLMLAHLDGDQTFCGEDTSDLLTPLGLGSALLLPLKAGGRAIGVLTLVAAKPESFGDSAKRELAEEFACRAALALERACLYRDEQRLTRIRDEFIATLSHELRTPLSVVLGWTQLLRTETPSPAFLNEALTTIERSARSQCQIIDDLLDLSRMITGTLDIESQEVQLGALTEEAIATLAVAANAKGIHIGLSFEGEGRTASVLGDPSRLRQIIWNLVANAVKFTPALGRVNISVSCGADGEVTLRVVDTGKGITPNFLPHVFDRFSQEESSLSRRHGGLGLGLAIVRHLVDLHGGAIRAESAGLGGGASFTVTLPAYRQNAPSRASLVALPPSRPRLAGVRVLLVDDALDIRMLASLILKKHGAEVTSVGSAAEAYAALTVKRPDVLLSDIGMPEEDGYQLMRRVRDLPGDRQKPLPAAAITAHARDEDRNEALAAGFELCLTKPFDPDQLVATVARLTGRSNAVDERREAPSRLASVTPLVAPTQWA